MGDLILINKGTLKAGWKLLIMQLWKF